MKFLTIALWLTSAILGILIPCIGIILSYYKKDAVRPDPRTCSCSCWDGLFKGPHPRIYIYIYTYLTPRIELSLLLFQHRVANARNLHTRVYFLLTAAEFAPLSPHKYNLTKIPLVPYHADPGTFNLF
jgi:hypothetical protein